MSAPKTLLDRNQTLLLVVDVQDRINSVMANQSHLPRIEVLVDACAAIGVPVVVTEQYPKGLGGSVASLASRLQAPPVVKYTFSCAREPAVRSAIESHHRRQVVVAGIETHVCVLQTALDLHGAGYDVHIPHDAVNSRRQEDAKWALRRLASAGATVTSTESAIFELVERCGTDDFRAVAGLIKRLPVEN